MLNASHDKTYHTPFFKPGFEITTIFPVPAKASSVAVMFDILSVCRFSCCPAKALNIASAAIMPLLIVCMDALDSTCIERTGITTNQQTTR